MISFYIYKNLLIFFIIMQDLSNIISLEDFTFDSIKKCYKPKKNNINIKFDQTVITKQSQVLFMLAIEYNSIRRPAMGLKINEKIVNFDLLSKSTSSDNSLLAFRYEEGPFYLKSGKNEIEIICQGLCPDIYSIELYPYKDNINKTINPYSYKLSDFVYLDCYNLYGGFFWHINNFIICCYFCEKFGKIPIVNFTNGLFMNNTSIESYLIKKNTNWFYNYFQNYVELPPSIYECVINAPNKVRLNQKTMNNYRTYKKFCNENQTLEFRREGFLSLREKVYTENAHSKLIKKYLKPLPHITQLVKNIKDELFPQKNENLRYIGIHYRGTDKIEEELNKEQHPKHYKYQDIYNLIVDTARDLIKENENYDIYIIACSDEQPLIDFLKKKLRNKLLYYKDANRSNLETSNLSIDFTQIPNRDKNIDENKLDENKKEIFNKRKELIDNSIHMGSKNISNYKKGLDCLIDVLLLDEVDVLLQSKGNFSLYCEYFNKNENLKVIPIHTKI